MRHAISSSHQSALDWFREKHGQVIGWPLPLDGSVFLANKAKGIHKPAGLRYALSVRTMIKGPYPDKELETDEHGRWLLRYFQEGADPADRDRSYTNRGLMACMEDAVPIGVLQQVAARPTVRYRVLGLARVTEWRDGYFTLIEERSATVASSPSTLTAPISVEDARRRTLALIVQRQGQSDFRAALMQAYGGRCAITGCNVPETLEAAHIVPYLGSQTNVTRNGLLLRADLHNLFDLGLIAIHPKHMTVLVAESLSGSEYELFKGRMIGLPTETSDNPDQIALASHLAESKVESRFEVSRFVAGGI